MEMLTYLRGQTSTVPHLMTVCITHAHTCTQVLILCTYIHTQTPAVKRPTVSLVLYHPHMSPGRAVFIIVPTFLMRELGSNIAQIYNIQQRLNGAQGAACPWGTTCVSAGLALCSGGSNYPVGGCSLLCFPPEPAHLGVAHPCSQQGPWTVM